MNKDSQSVCLLKKMDRRTIGQMTIVLCFVFLMPVFVACKAKNDLPDIKDGTPENLVVTPSEEKNKACPQLDSKLYHLYLMDDPIPSAEQLGFRVVNGKVQVLLILTDEDTAIPTGFDLEVGTHIRNQVQVFVAFDALCELANTDEVIAIRQPMAPILE